MRWLGLLALALACAGCGGGSQEPSSTQPAKAPQRAAASAPTATDLLNWAENNYRQLFLGHESNQTSGSYTYRYYPGTGNYLGVSGQDLYVLGPVTGGALRHVGVLADFNCSVYECLSPFLGLRMSASYTGNPALLGRPHVWQANLVNLEGPPLLPQTLTPQCSIARGILFAGLSIDPTTCNIVGTPLEYGEQTVDVRIQAIGSTQEAVARSVFLRVDGPPVTYPSMSTDCCDVGGLYSFDPSYVNGFMFPAWQATAGESAAYSLYSGSLPPGMSLDPATGRISGALQAEGDFIFRIMTLTQGSWGVTRKVSEELWLSARLPINIYYSYASAQVGQPFSTSPNVYTYGSDFSATYAYTLEAGRTLPPGLSLNAATGAITGTPTAPVTGSSYYGIDVVVTRNGVSFNLSTWVQIYVAS
jgi:hypothetical protein